MRFTPTVLAELARWNRAQVRARLEYAWHPLTSSHNGNCPHCFYRTKREPKP